MSARPASWRSAGSSEKSAAVVTKVYCFDGKVEVSIDGKVEPIVLSEDEMVEIREKVVELKDIEPEIREYWRLHDFRASAAPEPPAEIMTAEALEKQRLFERAEEDARVSAAAGIMFGVAGVVTGIGFLGAGTIIRSAEGIKGLTTAASVWVSSAIGLAVGCGYISAAITVTLIVYLVLSVLKKLEKDISAHR